MIARQDYRVRVTFRRDPLDRNAPGSTELTVSACDPLQALDLAVSMSRLRHDLTPYDEVSATLMESIT